jgi:DNA ligase-4
VKEVVAALNAAIDRREEGLLLKDPDSVYKPNIRNKGGWVKVKPEYSNELMDMPDLLILGGQWRSDQKNWGNQC